MPRDRLAALRQIQGQEYYGEYESGDGEQANGGAGGYERDSMVIQMESLDDGLSGFLSQVEDIRELLRVFRENVELVKKKHSEILSSPNTDDPRRKELDDLMAKIKSSSALIRSKLKEIESGIKKEEGSDECSAAVLRIKKTQHSALLRLFIDSMNDYQLAQSDYRDRCKQRIKRQLEITGTSLNDEQIEEKMEQGNWSFFTQGIISDTAQAKQMLADIEARHNDILQLEKSIKELHELFVEMALLVENQGEQIDRIENHVTSAKDHVEKAQVQTSQALSYQRSARKKKICIILTLIAIVALIILILYLTW